MGLDWVTKTECTVYKPVATLDTLLPLLDILNIIGDQKILYEVTDAQEKL